MEWTNILKRSKAHTSRKIRRGRLHPSEQYRGPKRGVPMVGAMDDPKLEARKDKPMPDYEQILADKTVEELREMLNSQIESMDKKDVMNLLVRSRGKFGVEITEE